jgi:hypothetical protein
MTMPSGLWRLYQDGPFPRIQVLAGNSPAQRLESLAAVADSEILVVAGGLGNLENAIDALRKVAVPCVYVLGPSELSGHDFSEAIARARDLAQGSNVHVLEKSEAVVNGVRFLGATLCSSFADWQPALVKECLEHLDKLIGIDATTWWRNPDIHASPRPYGTW